LLLILYKIIYEIVIIIILISLSFNFFYLLDLNLYLHVFPHHTVPNEVPGLQAWMERWQLDRCQIPADALFVDSKRGNEPSMAI
jgi:hypothetical protein